MAHYLNNNNFLNTTDSFDSVSDSFDISSRYAVGGHQLEILKWLFPLEPQVRHKDIQRLRADNLGDRFLKTVPFRSWRGASGEVNPENATVPYSTTASLPHSSTVSLHYT